MANKNGQGFGLIAAGMLGQTPATQGLGKYKIDAGYATTIYNGGAVASAAGYIVDGQTTDAPIIGVLNGILWSTVVALAVYLWFNSIFLGIVIASALMINLIIGAISGVSLPLILSKLKIDPALAGGVILTTITDIVGFISLLGIATLIM